MTDGIKLVTREQVLADIRNDFLGKVVVDEVNLAIARSEQITQITLDPGFGAKLKQLEDRISIMKKNLKLVEGMLADEAKIVATNKSVN